MPTTPAVVGATSDAFVLNKVTVEGWFVFSPDFFRNGVPLFDAGVEPPSFADVKCGRSAAGSLAPD